MTISNTDRSVTYIGNNSTTVFPYTFLIPDAESANVVLTDLTTGIDTVVDEADYTISGLGNKNGGTVTYPTVISGNPPIDTNTQNVIFREVPATQEVGVSNQTGYDAKVVESVWDRLTMMQQDSKGDAALALRYPVGDPASNVVPNKVTRAEKYFYWDVDGNPQAQAIIVTDAPVTPWSADFLLAANTLEGQEKLSLDPTASPTFDSMTVTTTLGAATGTFTNVNATTVNTVNFNVSSAMPGVDLDNTSVVDLNSALYDSAGMLTVQTDINDVLADNVAGVRLMASSVNLLQITKDTEVIGDAIASTAEAEAGTGTHLMTAEKTAEAITAQSSGGASVWLETLVAANSPTIDFITGFNTIYGAYFVEYYDITVGPTNALVMQWSNDGGSTFISSGSAYKYSINSTSMSNNPTPTGKGSQSNDSINVTNFIGTGAGDAGSGIINLPGFSQTMTGLTQTNFNYTYGNGSSTGAGVGGGLCVVGGPFDGIRFKLVTAGNLLTGTFSLYGVIK